MAERDGAGGPSAWLDVRVDERLDPPRDREFLHLRRIVTTVAGVDGSTSAEGTWDFVERAAGVDAVVVLVFRRGPGGVEVLLRRGLRVPASLGRPEHARGPGRRAACFVEETVAGVAEPGEHGPEGLRERARSEVHEEAGIELPSARLSPLGAPLWESPGVWAQVLHYFAADATGVPVAAPRGDGSPFEALAAIEWHALDHAIARVARDGREIGDLRTELGLRRLAAFLAGGG